MLPSESSRRRLLGLLCAGVTGTLAGCSDRLPGGDSTPTSGTEPSTDTETVTPTATLTPTPSPSPTPTPETVGAEATFGVEGDEKAFGTSLALSADGRTAVVGSMGFATTHRPPDPGAAYVFERVDAGWRRSTKLSYQGDDDRFGYEDGDEGTRFGSPVAVSADGDRCFVGDPYVGEVYVYDRSGDAFERTATLALEDPERGFGKRIDVSADGTRVVVLGSDTIEYTGPRIHVYGRTDEGWREEAKLTSRTGQGFGFGSDIAVSGDGERVLVGAPAADTEAGVESGAAYLYRRHDGDWDVRRTLVPEAGADHDAFAAVVALAPDGRTALVGARDEPEAEGSEVTTTYVFESTGEGWRRLTVLAPMPRYETAAFPASDTALVGHTRSVDAGDPLASLLRRGPDWHRDAVLVAPESRTWPNRSAASSADLSTALVGQGPAVGEQDPPAPVYAFDP